MPRLGEVIRFGSGVWRVIKRQFKEQPDGTYEVILIVERKP
jgi:hypothetical protein